MLIMPTKAGEKLCLSVLMQLRCRDGECIQHLSVFVIDKQNQLGVQTYCLAGARIACSGSSSYKELC